MREGEKRREEERWKNVNEETRVMRGREKKRRWRRKRKEKENKNRKREERKGGENQINIAINDRKGVN